MNSIMTFMTYSHSAGCSGLVATFDQYNNRMLARPLKMIEVSLLLILSIWSVQPLFFI